jgi:prophage DNA circulation protein
MMSLRTEAFFMAWADTLQDASFRGVRFDCERIADSRNRQQVIYQAPYSDTAIIEDLGADPRKVTLRAWITGDDYEQYRDALVLALDQTGRGDFMHPQFGRLQASVTSYTVNHDTDTIDGCSVTIDFVLAPTAPARALFIPTPNTSLNVAALVMATPAQRLQTLQDQLPYFPQAIEAATLVDQIRTGIKTVRGYLNTVNSVINNALSPPAWINGILSDVAGLVYAIPTGASVIAEWRSIGKRLQLFGGLFNTDAHPEPLRHVGRSLQAAALLSAAQAIIVQQTQRATLSPAELVSIRNDVRGQITQLIALERAAAATQASQNAASTPPIPLATQTQVARLKQAADVIQTQIDALIARRPSLQSRPITTPTHLRLLAHRWYGDHTRAVELTRLNPDLINPAVIVGGEVSAYAD